MEKRTRNLLDSLMVLALVFLYIKIRPALAPLLDIGGMLLSSLVISVFIYYLLRRPLAYLSRGREEGKGLWALVCLLGFLGLMLVIVSSSGLVIREQFRGILEDPNQVLAGYTSLVEDRLQSLKLGGDLLARLVQYLERGLGKLGGALVGLVGELGDISTQLILIPFMVYYLLRDDGLVQAGARKMLLRRGDQKLAGVLARIDRALANYIGGQMLVALIIGGLMFLGYRILGLPHSFVMASFSTLTAFIPIIGAFLGIVPALLIGLSLDLGLALKIVVLSLIVQQLEGNIITPRIMSNKLALHPLTVMLAIIIGLKLIGILGGLVAVPLYLIINIIFKEYFIDSE